MVLSEADMIHASIPNRRPLVRVKVIFEFSVSKPKLFFYRAVQAIDGSYRMEKRGANAKTYRAFMWCGSEEGLYHHRQAVEFCDGPSTSIFPPELSR